MILRRLGNKSKIAEDIITYFPDHKIYVEPFFGAGGMFFNKRKAKYNIVNDLDCEVVNLFQVIQKDKIGFEEVKKSWPEFENADWIAFGSGTGIRFWLNGLQNIPFHILPEFLRLV